MCLLKSCLAMGLMAWSVNCLSAAEENCQQFQVNNGRLSIPVTIAGTESRAVINSGILTMGISSFLAGQLGLDIIEPEPDSRRRGGGLPQLSIVENVPIEVFGQDIEMEQLYVFDLNAPLVNFSVMMFQDLVVQMDYPQSRICFLNPATIDLEAAENINMRSTRTGAPAIEVKLNDDQDVWLNFQIGYSGGISIDFETAEDLGFIEEDQEDGESAATAEATTESLVFGPYELGAINTTYSTEENSAQNRPIPIGGAVRAGRSRNRAVETHGELGFEILQHFVITIDFNEERMHIFAP
ncbi:MAG: hypothetical protein QGF90_15890 [Gammaproteobacteria bacterium]|jgi:hypothetical protein|nr:hypothetical protein [Gammaproteobacteria bacterium]